jgi:hypothetical protein
MKTRVYLVLTRAGAVRAIKTHPQKLSTGEIAVRILLDVPDALFAPPPILDAELTVPGEYVPVYPTPVTLTLDPPPETPRVGE